MQKLAKNGFVIPSLGHYDSYSRGVKNDPDSQPGYEREQCKDLEVLYRDPDETGCRIASVRRAALFEALGFKHDPEKWAPLFINPLKRMKEDQRKVATGNPDVNGALAVLSSNYDYVRILGKDYPEAMQWCQELEDQKSLTVGEIRSIAPILNGLKTKFSSPITAAYGGVYNLSIRNYVNMYLSKTLNQATQLWHTGSTRKRALSVWP